MFSAGVTGWWAGLAIGGKRLPDGSSLSGLLAPGTYTVLGSCYLNGKSIRKQVEVEVRSGETTEVTVDLTAE